MTLHFRRLWRNLVHRDRVERDLDDELQGTYALLVEEKVRAGMTPKAARRAAGLQLGGVTVVADSVRDVRRGNLVNDVLQDIRYALRQFRHNPGFTAIAVATLAIGIGINSAVFTVVDTVLFKGFRLVAGNDRVVYIHSQKNGVGYSGVSYPDFLDWRDQGRSFDEMGAAADLKIRCDRGGGFTEVCFATRVTANAFRLLGQKPMLGRDFVPSDEQLGAAPVAILSYGFWERRFSKRRPKNRRGGEREHGLFR